MFDDAVAQVRPLIELSVDDHRAAGAHFQINADRVAQRVVEPEFGHGRGVGIVDHDAGIMHVLRDGAQLDAGIAHDAAEADGRSVRGDDALDGEGDS